MLTFDYKLWSPVVPPKSDGMYPYYQSAYLIPHEAIRREFDRCTQALANFDPIRCPWKAHCLNVWLKRFFLPSVHTHHEVEERVLFLEYVRKGVSVPQYLSDEHKQLLKLLLEVSDASDGLVSEVKLGVDNINPSKVREHVSNLNRAYQSLNELTINHINDEERFWPAEIEKYGEKFYREVEEKVLQYGAAHGGRDFQNMGCSILDAMGIMISGVPLQVGDKGWCGIKNHEDFMASFSPEIRRIELPAWNKRYQKYKLMIRSIQGDVDILQVQDHPNDLDYYESFFSSAPSCCILC